MKTQHDTNYAPLFPYFSLASGTVVAEGELVIDNFAGGGGASTGLEQALGRPVDIAVNHDPEAIAMHAINHPHTQHFCESVWEVDPREVTAGRPVALCWFSPDCKHFSKAKGGKPVNKEIRGLAWVALRWAATVKPRVIVVENVEEFKTWGPLAENGRPCPKDSGRTFRSWVNALQRQGYEVQWRELRAYEYGAPTSRKRLFIVARRDGQPIIWPEPTHGKPTDARVQTGELQEWRTAAECIDWDIPCPSIFHRKKPLVPATNRRIAQGILRFTLQAAKPFVVTCNHQGEGFRGQGVDEPVKTLTATHDATGPVVAQIVRHNHGEKPADAADEPTRTVTTQHNHLNLLTAALAPRYGEREGQPPRAQTVKQPTPTITTSGNGTRLATVNLTKFRSNSAGTAMTELIHTAAADEKRSEDGAAFDVAACQITTFYGEKKQGEVRGQPLNAAIKTQTSGGNRHALTQAKLAKVGGIVGCGGRAAQAQPHGLNATVGTLTTKADRCLAAATIIKIDNQKSRTSCTYPVTVPVATEVAKASKALVAAQLIRHNGGFCQPEHAGRSVETPNPTVTAQGGPQSLTTAQLIQYNGTSEAQPVGEPSRTIPTKDRFGLTTAQIIRQFRTSVGHPANTPTQTVMSDGGGGKSYLLTTSVECGLMPEQLAGAQQAYAFLSVHLGAALEPYADHDQKLVLVVIKGETYVLTDIGMRMLEPKELYKAQGFPKGYRIDFSLKGKPLSKRAQVKMCGNAVPPQFSRAIAHANLVLPMQEAAD